MTHQTAVDFPRNVGESTNPDGIGTVGDPACGDFLRICIKVEDNRLVDIKFKVYGCPAAIATSSILTEMAKGKTLDEAIEITEMDVVKALGDLPDPKIHCSNIGTEALRRAIYDFKEGKINS
jgi:nitrogen fixation NifU-like protein